MVQHNPRSLLAEEPSQSTHTQQQNTILITLLLHNSAIYHHLHNNFYYYGILVLISTEQVTDKNNTYRLTFVCGPVTFSSKEINTLLSKDAFNLFKCVSTDFRNVTKDFYLK